MSHFVENFLIMLFLSNLRQMKTKSITSTLIQIPCVTESKNQSANSEIFQIMQNIHKTHGFIWKLPRKVLSSGNIIFIKMSLSRILSMFTSILEFNNIQFFTIPIPEIAMGSWYQSNRTTRNLYHGDMAGLLNPRLFCHRQTWNIFHFWRNKICHRNTELQHPNC